MTLRSTLLAVPAAAALALSLLGPAGTATAAPDRPDQDGSAGHHAGKHPGKHHGKPGQHHGEPGKQHGIDQLRRPLVFGHRGAAGYRPEHTLASYRLAIRLGADYVEPDLVPTKDGVLVARHENDITATTDVADHPEFADRKTTKTVDGKEITGWFTEDFTLAELETLRAKERIPEVRPDNTRYDGRFKVPTFAQVIRLVQRQEKKTGRVIGIAPETKHPTYFDSIGLSTEEPMLATLDRFGLDHRGAKVLIQSFEISNLRRLDRQTDLPLEQLVDATGGPFDQRGRVTYDDMVTARGLRDISRYADWVGPEKGRVLPRNADGATTVPSPLVRRAHRVGLHVVVFTLRRENQFMPTNFRRGTDPDAAGRIRAEVTAYYQAGVDAVFADQPDEAVAARDAYVRHR